MGVVKNPPNYLKHSRLPFTTTINATIEAIEDPASLGIFLYLTSKPENWQISEINLQNRFKKGRDFIRTRMRELKKLGLIKNIPIKNDKGIIVYWETMLYSEVQVTENPYCGDESTLLKIQVPGFSRCLENPPTTNKGFKTNKEDLKKERLKEKINKKEKPQTPSSADAEGDSVFFNDFYSVYPIKKGKKEVKKWFKKNKPNEEFVLMLIADVKKRLSSEWAMMEQKFIPHPANYLSGCRWEDSISAPGRLSPIARLDNKPTQTAVRLCEDDYEEVIKQKSVVKEEFRGIKSYADAVCVARRLLT